MLNSSTLAVLGPFQNVSVRTKLSLVLATIVCLMFVVGIFGLVQLHAVNRLAAEMRDGWLPRIELLGELKSAVGQHFHLATRRLQTTNFRHLAEIAKGTKSTQATISSVSKSYELIMDTPEERQLLDEFQDNWARYLATDQEIFARLEIGDINSAVMGFNTSSRDAFNAAGDRLDALVAHTKQKSQESTASARHIYRQALMLIAAVMTIGGLCALAAVAWSRRHVTAPILSIADAMRQLTSGDLDLAVTDTDDRRDEIGTLIASVTAYRDSLKRGRELAAVAELERRRLLAAISNMPIGLCMFDGIGQLIVCNTRYVDMFDLPTELSRPGTRLQHILDTIQDSSGNVRKNLIRTIDELAAGDLGQQPLTRMFRFSCGRTISASYQAMPGGGWVATHEDVTERQRAEAQIAHMAHHDSLTNLPNRVLFHERLVQALKRVPRGEQLAILCLDLDRFKNVNDTLGHPIGDQLLIQVARRLLNTVRDVDTVARLGGDEFAIVQVGGRQPEGARLLAERLVPAISKPYEIDGYRLMIGTSIGIALVPEHGSTADLLLANADLALYEAKNEGRGTYRFFENEMASRMSTKRAIELDLRQAFEDSNFELFYQPLVHLEHSEVRGFEALLRWRRPDGSITPPGDFMSIAEEIGLIVPLGAWIMERACLEAASWPGKIRVAVNVSAIQLHHRDFLKTVEGILDKTAFDPDLLELEITETALLRDSNAVLEPLQRLRELGIRLALDDFGIGYSSLSYLRTFPFQRIKIDGSFIRNLAKQDGSLAIIRAVTGLGAALGMETTAEGIETEAQLACVQSEGCTDAQGYLFSPPVPAHQITSVLSDLDGRRRKSVKALPTAKSA